MVYLDHNSTTPLNTKAYTAMGEQLMNAPLNPNSVHSYGSQARRLLEDARHSLLTSLNASKYNLLFTSSGTESNNLILKNFYQDQIFISQIEHSSIYEHIRYTSNIELIKVDNQGLLDIQDLESKLRTRKKQDVLVSVIYANNETGVIQDLANIVKVVKENGALIHSDFSQAPGKKECNLDEFNLDFVTISGHKFGGPIGTAALLYKKEHHLIPEIIGGGQEKGIRSGTQNVIGAVGMAAALRDVQDNLNDKVVYIKGLRDVLENRILSSCPNARIASKGADRLCNTSMIIMPGRSGQQQVIYFDLKGFAVSSGSACSSGKISEPRILSAMNFSSDSNCGIRVSLSLSNTLEEIEEFSNIWIKFSMQPTISTGT